MNGDGRRLVNTLDQAIALYSGGQYDAALKLALADAGPLLNILAGSAQSLGLHEDAEYYWRLVLSLQPGNHHAYNNIGLLLAQKGQSDEAESSYRQALAICPDFAEGYSNLGLLLFEQKRPAEAEAALRLAIELKPGLANAHNNLGELLRETQRHDEAEAAYRRALAAQPDHVMALYNLGLLLVGLKRCDEAETAYRQAIAIRPDYAEAHSRLAILLKSTSRHTEAESTFRRLLTIRPNFAADYNDLAELLRETGRFEEAEAGYRQALALEPDFANAWNNLGILLEVQKRFTEAEQAYHRALALNPDSALMCNNLGSLYVTCKRYSEAEAAFQRAMALKPDFAVALSNLGVLHTSQKRYAEAESALRQALALDPSLVRARINLALVLLGQGRFSEGWALNEARNDPDNYSPRTVPPAPPFAQWQGEPLAGKTLLVWNEQGFGDEIQFCRFIPELKRLGTTRIDLACKPALKPLLETLAGVDAVYPAVPEQDFGYYDYWTYPMSIPLHIGLTVDTIPARLPYLYALPERLKRWQTRLPSTRPRIGLAWKGYAGYINDDNRSLPGLATLASLWTVPGLAFVSLQKGIGEDEALNPPPGLSLTSLGQDMADFADTAAIIDPLDLVICVDTAVGHLAGALNKPCWILLPYVKTDWRWLQEREDSPWYPGVVRLFRQGKDETWEDVAARVAAALADWGAGFRSV